MASAGTVATMPDESEAMSFAHVDPRGRSSSSSARGSLLEPTLSGMDEVDLGTSPIYGDILGGDADVDAEVYDLVGDGSRNSSTSTPTTTSTATSMSTPTATSTSTPTATVTPKKRTARLDRLRSLHRRATPLYQTAHDMTSNLVSMDRSVVLSKANALGGAMMRMRRGGKPAAAESTTALDHKSEFGDVDERLELLGQTPLLQGEDELIFIEKADGAGPPPRVVARGDYVRVQSVDGPKQSWLCQISSDHDLPCDADMLPLARPFQGSDLLDALVYYVPEDCLPVELRAPPATESPSATDVDAADVDADVETLVDVDMEVDVDVDVTDHSRSRSDSDSSVDLGRDSDDHLRGSSESWTSSGTTTVDDDRDSSSGDSSSQRSASTARQKAAALYGSYRARGAGLRTAEYKERLSVAGQVSKEKLSRMRAWTGSVRSRAEYNERLAAVRAASKEKLSAAGHASMGMLSVAGHVSKEKLSVAGQVSKEKLSAAGHVSKVKLSAATKVSKDKLSVAGLASKERLSVAGHASREKLSVAGSASREKLHQMHSWSSSFMKTRVLERVRSKSGHEQAAGELELELAVTPTAKHRHARANSDTLWATYEPSLDDMSEEAQLLREMGDC